MAKVQKKTRQEAVAAAVGAGRELYLESVDFSDPNRPRTCLEVDFPILPVNTLANIEGKGSGALKPIYQTMKWWARRRSTVFRQLLIASATKAPIEETEAAKVAWNAYYGNHQRNPNFRKLQVADPFMGGGTTLVEGTRLGMNVYGNDLNPVAWFIVKNELTRVDPIEAKQLLDHIESEVKPQIMPFYACDCPRGHKGKWIKASTGEVMDGLFDPLKLTPDQRKEFKYEGPEVIYTFWAKHGPCQATECDHLTPIKSSPVVAGKSLVIKAWIDRECRNCGKIFDVEPKDARMAPTALFVIAQDEKTYALMSDNGLYKCPHCGHNYHDEAAAWKGESAALGKLKAKRIELNLLVHPDWLNGQKNKLEDGTALGGSATDTPHTTAAWNGIRDAQLKLIEVRGNLPAEITCPDTGVCLYTDSRGGTIPRKATFTCRSSTCGLDQDVLDSIRQSGKTAPSAIYAVQGYCKECDDSGAILGGRFFDVPTTGRYDAAVKEWDSRKEGDLRNFWPRTELSFGWTTHGWSIPGYGYTHYWKMFNPRQLLAHSLVLRSSVESTRHSCSAVEISLGAFQQYLRNQNMFCFWNQQRALEPMFSNNNYAPKNTVVENSVFSGLGRGDFKSCSEKVIEALEWSKHPWEIAVTEDNSHSDKVRTNDPVQDTYELECGSATNLHVVGNGTLDLVVTDPPFGEIMQYAAHPTSSTSGSK